MNNTLSSQFIVDDEHIKQNTEELVKKALKYAKITKNGIILIEDNTLSQENKLKLCLAVRFLANSLDENITNIIRPSELTKTLGERPESVGSRLSKLASDGFAKKIGFGQYAIHPYRVEPFLNSLETPRKESGSRNISSNKTHPSSGISGDIQALIDGGFFNTPKFMSDVKTKLEEEVKFHDIRLIDKTVRTTFVSSKKILKRIKNDGKGVAKWKYVIRK